MTSAIQQIGIGTKVSYEDMANPLRHGRIVGEVGGGVQWAVRWDASDAEALYEIDGLRFHSTVTKHMLDSAVSRQAAARKRGTGRIAGWNADLLAPALSPNVMRMLSKYRNPLALHAEEMATLPGWLLTLLDSDDRGEVASAANLCADRYIIRLLERRLAQIEAA